MTVNPNFAPSKGMWDGTTMNIPGLMPVNIGSSDPYPVTFQTPRPAPHPQQASPAYAPPTMGGAGYGQPDSAAGFSGDQNSFGLPGSPQSGADALFSLFGNSFLGGPGSGMGGGSGGQSGGGDSYGFAPSYAGGDGLYASTPGGTPVDPMAGWRAGDITSMPLAPIGQGQSGQSGQGYFDRLGSNISDRINSFGDAPDFTAGNAGQAAINAGGLFSPIIPALAGIFQGFNLYDAPDTTGNPLADIAGTPGAIQTGVANATNWIDRLFGGTHMPSSYVDPTAMGPNPDGSPYSSQIGMNNGRSQSTQGQQNAILDLQSGQYNGTPFHFDNTQQGYTGAPMQNLGGADIFNAIGASPLSWQDRGGAENMPSPPSTGPSAEDVKRWAALNSTGNQWLD